MQANSDFWKRKLDPPMRKPRAGKTLARKKKAAASEIHESHNSEVTLNLFWPSPHIAY